MSAKEEQQRLAAELKAAIDSMSGDEVLLRLRVVVADLRKNIEEAGILFQKAEALGLDLGEFPKDLIKFCRQLGHEPGQLNPQLASRLVNKNLAFSAARRLSPEEQAALAEAPANEIEKRLGGVRRKPKPGPDKVESIVQTTHKGMRITIGGTSHELSFSDACDLYRRMGKILGGQSDEDAA
jgi:hypothetical protein